MKLKKHEINLADITQIFQNIKEDKPLIHCITNPISINDCANAVLSIGAKPIMAEHPKEVAGITSMAKALAVNLGNITDARMESIIISGKTALDRNIPSVIDAVGVTCSSIRLGLAKQYITSCKPSIIKGNISEIKVLGGVKSDAAGIDVSDNDVFSVENDVLMEYTADIVKKVAIKTGAVVVASGKVDTISDGKDIFFIENGCEMMSQLTGTGCMLNVLIGAYSTASTPLQAAVAATCMLGISGELSETTKGMGTFHMNLLDNLSVMTPEIVCKKAKVLKAI